MRRRLSVRQEIRVDIRRTARADADFYLRHALSHMPPGVTVRQRRQAQQRIARVFADLGIAALAADERRIDEERERRRMTTCEVKG